MYRTANSHRMIGLAVTTAMAGALLSGCTTTVAPRAEVSASRAEAALAQGKDRQAVQQAEAAVLAEPRNAAYRATLATAYLNSGRFASAETTFNDALALGDETPRTALSLSLAMLGQGKLREAGKLLSQWEDRIAPADLGLALALSGEVERGIYVMSNAIRAGRNDAKIRQNLAYAYALAGRWRESRLMAAQDVPADKVGERMEQWAMSAQPEAYQTRIAGLLDVPAGVADAGQPIRLALVNNPSLEQLAAEATAVAAAPAAEAELPALAEAPAPVLTPMAPPVLSVAEIAAPAPLEFAAAAPALPAPAPVAAPVAETPRPATFATTFAAPAVAASSLAAVTPDASRFAEVAAKPVATRERAVRAPRTVASAPAEEGTHLIQLGSFTSEAGAKRAWKIYASKYPELAGHRMVISEAVVRGKHYYRVSAAGFGRASSSAMCGKVTARGEGCFAYAEGRPLPGAVDTGVRLARR